LEDIEYTKCGCIQLATTPEELKFAKKSYEGEVDMVRKPEAVKFCKSLEEVRDILPEAGPSVLGGVYTPNSGQVNAGLAAHKCAEIAEERGAIVRENVTVKKITKSNGVYTVESSRGEIFRAKAIVVAAGAWANDVIGKNKVDVYKVKGEMGLLGWRGGYIILDLPKDIHIHKRYLTPTPPPLKNSRTNGHQRYGSKARRIFKDACRVLV
jgi:glycine oxidase